MNLNYVEIKNSQNVVLHGYYTGKKFDTCIIYVPGLGANYSSSNIPKFILESCENKNIDFLCAHNQGNYLMTELIVDDKEKSVKKGGAAYDTYENWYPDISAWINYLSNYKQVIVVAHSLGCNKVVDFLLKSKKNNIIKTILLAPQDIKYLLDSKKHIGMYEEAIENRNKQKNNLISTIFLGFCYLSTDTFLDFFENKNIDNIPYINSEKFDLLLNLYIPINIIIGSNDKNIDLSPYLKNISRKCKFVKCKIIEGANHNFINKESELINAIFE